MQNELGYAFVAFENRLRFKASTEAQGFSQEVSHAVFQIGIGSEIKSIHLGVVFPLKLILVEVFNGFKLELIFYYCFSCTIILKPPEVHIYK
ncbi:CLUMA_CG013267, isoform A [Clunio marinus]|uniref:CLUMA_CG013267, isoform A n=1 Tax=Clunio marinus TaxID=568069 RepID=A0A1J1IKA5_9DIPT|nr:CLUMA_CG013267, isoform A [Clunio marinus]